MLSTFSAFSGIENIEGKKVADQRFAKAKVFKCTDPLLVVNTYRCIFQREKLTSSETDSESLYFLRTEIFHNILVHRVAVKLKAHIQIEVKMKNNSAKYCDEINRGCKLFFYKNRFLN